MRCASFLVDRDLPGILRNGAPSRRARLPEPGGRWITARGPAAIRAANDRGESAGSTAALLRRCLPAHPARHAGKPEPSTAAAETSPCPAAPGPAGSSQDRFPETAPCLRAQLRPAWWL